MRKKDFFVIFLIVTFLIVLWMGKGTAVTEDSGPLRLVQMITLPTVKGRIDHMALDVAGQRLFIAALENNTLEIVDLRSGRRIQSIGGLHEPQDVYYLAESDRIIVSNGGDGSLRFFDGHSLNLTRNINFHDDADNLRYDPQTKYLYLGYGKGLGIVDTRSDNVIGDIGFSGHPEAFHLESAGPRIFVNIPSARQVAVIDRTKRSVIAVWPLKGAGNFPIALDEERHRLFVGCRHPARMLIYDTQSGSKISEVDIGLDADDIFFDAANRQIYASCGQGYIVVIHQKDADHYEVTARVKTRQGARTSRFAADQSRLYVAAPAMPGKSAVIFVYAVVTK